MLKRSSYLDVVKFLFSIIIVLYHFGIFFEGGYIVVEAFFMISGFFLMKSASRAADNLPLGEATLKFVWRKYKSIVYYLIPSAIIGLIAYIYIIPRESGEVIKQATLMIFELIPLQSAGFPGFFTTGVAWYLSALLLASALIYALVKKIGSTFSQLGCPIIAVLIYGVLAHNFGHLCLPNLWILDIVNTGFLRGVAGICAGCFLYECTRFTRDKISVGKRIVFTVLEVAGFAYAVYMMHERPHSAYDFAVLIVFFGLLLVGIKGYSYISGNLSFSWSCHLASASTVIYLNHFYWGRFVEVMLSEKTKQVQTLIYFALIIVTSAFVFVIGNIAPKILRRKEVNKNE